MILNFFYNLTICVTQVRLSEKEGTCKMINNYRVLLISDTKIRNKGDLMRIYIKSKKKLRKHFVRYCIQNRKML